MAFPATFSLSSLDGSNGLTINGIAVGDGAGTTVASAGDLNHDGLGDLIISAPGAHQSYVVFGRAGGFGAASLELSDLGGGAGIVLEGGGGVVSSGDVNGDGIDDVIVGGTAGSAVVFGHTGGFAASLTLSALAAADGFAFASTWGAVKAAGDVNDDGHLDFIAGSKVIFGDGGATAPVADLSALDGSDGFTIAKQFSESAIDEVEGIGDINGDGFDDLAVVAGFRQYEFRATHNYVVFGAGSFNPVVQLSAIDGANGFAVPNINFGNSSLTTAASAGDIDNDGIDDLIIGEASWEYVTGDAYRYGNSVLIAGGTQTVLNQMRGNDVAGIGDVNGDGIDDVLLVNRTVGEGYIAFGQSNGYPSTVERTALDGVIGFNVGGIAGDRYSNVSAAGIGDVNGDGIADFIIGTGGGNPGGRTGAGIGYVVFGQSLPGEANHAPTVDGPLVRTINEDSAAPFSINLMLGAKDADFDALSVTGFSPVGGTTLPPSFSFDGRVVSFDPDDFDALTAGQSAVLQFAYQVSDGAAAAVAQTLTVTVEGRNNLSAPVVSGPLDLAAVVGTPAPVTVNLLQRASDPDGNPLTITGLTQTGGPAIPSLVVVGTELRIDPNDFSTLGIGDAVALTFAYAIADDHFSTPQSLTLTVLGSVPEPNDTFATRILLPAGTTEVAGVITRSEEQDFFSFTGLTPGVSFTAQFDPDVDLAGPTLAPIMFQFDDAGHQVSRSYSDRDFPWVGVVPASGVLTFNVTDGSGWDVGQDYGSSVGGYVVTLYTTDGSPPTATDGADSLIGGDAADTIDGLGGDDIIRGRGGNDTIDGGVGNDSLYGDDGNDSLLGGTGNDLVDGGAGNDVIDGGAGNDSLDGDGGNDLLLGGDGDDFVHAGGGGRKTIDGGAGNDRLIGSAGSDRMWGGDGDDTVYGSDSDDTIDGGSGNDSIDGGSRNDSLLGGDGDDTVYGGSANDTIDGGSGSDSLYGNENDDLLTGGGGDDRLSGGVGRDTLSGGTGNDRLFGNAQDDLLQGNAGADYLSGGDGNDSLAGGNGDDRLLGDDGDDVVNGEAGEDSLDGGKGNDTLIGWTSHDTLTGGEGADRFYFHPDATVAVFGDAPDVITDFSVADGDRINLVKLDIPDFAALEALFVSQGADTLIDLTPYGGRDILVLGVAVATLDDATNFAL